ncbi:MAG: DUF4097 family beta strand repeat protein [Acidobacteria bacterium]|nr:DUF4097 family beta strand repeat protein [Acidobacteriota bacterium]MBV9625286.1 DUF4097 family beta strand repeat protein [Acidobacteriota bacterium]
MQCRLLPTLRLSILTLAVLLAPGSEAFAVSEGSFERTLTVSGPLNLEVETGSGSIRVSTGGANEVRVSGHIRASNWFHSADDEIKKLESNPPIQQSGNDIRVGHIDDPELRRNVSISYELVVPEATQLHSTTGSGNQQISGIAGPLEASTGSGNTKISSIGGAVRARTGSGGIQVSGIKGAVFARAGSGSIEARDVSGGLDAETGSGQLTFQQSAPGAVRAETGSGRIELHNLRGSLQAQAGSGNIAADGEATGQWLVRTGSGNVELRMPQNASFDLNAHTGSGSINLNNGVTVQGSIGRKEVRGKVGRGGVPVEVQTGSGTISID